MAEDEGAGRGQAHQPRPAAVRRRRGDQARPGRLPRRGGRPDHPGAAGPAAVGRSGSTGARRRSCRRTSPSTRPTGCRPCSSGPRRRSGTCPTPSATTAGRCCGSPTSGRSSTTRRSVRADRPDHVTHLVLDLDPPEGDGVRQGGAAPRTWSAQALDDAGLDGRGQDERRQGRARVRAGRRRGVAWRTPPPPPVPSRRGPSGSTPTLATTAFMKEDRGRQGLRRRDPRRRARPSSPPTARGSGPGVPVSFPVGWDDLDDVAPARLHDAHRPRPPRRPRSVGRADARAPGAARRPRRGGPRDPRPAGCRRCTRASDASGSESA